jgi:hypothetical protein
MLGLGPVSEGIFLQPEEKMNGFPYTADVLTFLIGKCCHRTSISKNKHDLIFLFCCLRILLYTCNNLNQAVRWIDMPLFEFSRIPVEMKLTDYCERNIPANQRQ